MTGPFDPAISTFLLKESLAYLAAMQAIFTKSSVEAFRFVP
jgi:hypothetical protein